MKCMKSVKKINMVVSFTGVLFLSIMLGSCKDGKKQANLSVLRFSDAVITNYSPVTHLAIEGGIAKKNGLRTEVELTYAMEPLLTGKVDGKMNALIPSLLNGANGADISIFAGTMSGGHIIYANKKIAEELKNPKNWKGHSIGVRSQFTCQYVVPAALKDRYGYTDKDYSLKYYDDDIAVLSACSKGEVDIAPVYYSEQEMALSLGLVKIADVVDIATNSNYACCRQTANGEKFRSDRNLFVIWAKSLIQSWYIYNTNHDEALRVVQKITKQDKQWAYNHIYDANITANISFNPDPNYNDVLSQYDTAHELGFIKGNPRPLSSFFDISVYADALQETIKENPNEEFYKKMWTYFVEHNNRHPDFKEKYSKIL